MSWLFFEQQVIKTLKRRKIDLPLQIVHWARIDDERTEEYLAGVTFARNLSRHLGADELWRRATLTDDDLRYLEKRLEDIASSVRSGAFLPDWEYSGEHKLPVIPEPLALLSLTRTERRVDPAASMLAAAFVVLLADFFFTLIILVPPWVPSA